MKQSIARTLRKLGLSAWADRRRYAFYQWKNKSENDAFIKDYPDVKLPPDYLIYESFQMNYRKYYLGGLEDAKWMINLFSPYVSLSNISILDWGCGPARMIRHFPAILGAENQYFGSDYNPDTIAWCSVNIPGIRFAKNGLLPPLDFAEEIMDVIYGISVITHLSESNHIEWFRELHRVLKSGGILILTSHGPAFKEKLIENEATLFDQANLVTRGRVKEGHRMYSTFHPPSFLEKLFDSSGFHVLEYRPGKRENAHYIAQDIWIVKKR